jgi:tetratricopeptide (TPR) repeat protein
MTFGLYSLGLPGNFMFDDYPNLESLGAQGGVRDLLSLRFYLDDAFAGPTGRPISMLSFLIDARDWPVAPGPLKLKNVFIHLLNGVLLFWCLWLALKSSKVISSSGHALWIAAIATAWWLLHPFHVSTVLYIIQRMAQLSTLFVLVGLVGYLYGRRQLVASVVRGHLTMSVSLILGTSLAVLSKENGVLLPLLVLVMEYTLFSRTKEAQPDWRWKALFLWLPSLSIPSYMAWHVAGRGESILLSRGFSIWERVLTESRILLEYLYNLLVPHAQTKGMFRDTIEISTSLLSPVETLPAVLLVLVLIGGAIALRRRLPLLSLAILFYFAGHLLESTVIPLELYFEHRNYLPSVMLFLPIAQFVVCSSREYAKPAKIFGVVITLVLVSMLFARSTLWADREWLYLTWAEENPLSPRAQLSAANVLEINKKREQALAHMEQAVDRIPDNLLLRLHLLRMRRSHGLPVGAEALQRIEELARYSAYSHEALLAVRRLSEDVGTNRPGRISATQVKRIWAAMSVNPIYARRKGFKVQMNHQLGQLAAKAGNKDAAVRYFNKALRLTREIDTVMMQTAILASNGFYCEALSHLKNAEPLLEKDPRAMGKKAHFQREIKRIETVLKDDVANAGEPCG